MNAINNAINSAINGAITNALGSSGRKWLNIMAFGSSNVGATAINNPTFTDQITDFVAGKHYKLDHDDELVTFATPANTYTGSTIYTLINEKMYYGISEGLVKGLGALTSRKVAIATGFKSATPVGNLATSWLDSRNASNPFDMTTRYGQVITRSKKLMEATGEPIDIAYFPDAGRDAALGYIASVPYDAYIDGVANFRNDLNIPNCIIFIPNLGATPASGYSTWDAIKAKLTADLEANTTNVYLIEPESLGISLGNGIQHEWPLSVGESGTWTIGETLVGATSGASGIVSNYNLGSNIVWTENYVNFTAGEVVTGQTSGVTATLSNPLNPVTVHYNTDALNRISSDAVNKYHNNS